jgi:hypothetical protein
MALRTIYCDETGFTGYKGRLEVQMILNHKDAIEFREVAESELLSLHEGNFARYQIRPAEFAAWREAWGK